MIKDKEYIGKLVSKAALGDQCAWSDLYNKTFRDAYFVAIKITNNEDNAIELVHDAFVTVFDKVNQLDDKSKFQSWFNMIVANKCRDFLRKRKPVLFSDMETEDGILPDWEDERDDSRPEEIIDRLDIVKSEIIERDILKNFLTEIIEGYSRINAYYHNDLNECTKYLLYSYTAYLRLTD